MGNPRGRQTLAKVFLFPGVLDHLAPQSDGSSIFLLSFWLLTSLARRYPYNQRAYADAEREAKGHRA